MAKTNKKQTHESIKENTALDLVGSRGRVFEGYVVKKFPMRAVIEYETTLYVKKYERFYKKKSRIHARIPSNMQISVGDYIKVKECRPLSKIIHHVVIEKIRSVEIKEDKK